MEGCAALHDQLIQTVVPKCLLFGKNERLSDKADSMHGVIMNR